MIVLLVRRSMASEAREGGAASGHRYPVTRRAGLRCAEVTRLRSGVLTTSASSPW